MKPVEARTLEIKREQEETVAAASKALREHYAGASAWTIFQPFIPEIFWRRYQISTSESWSGVLLPEPRCFLQTFPAEDRSCCLSMPRRSTALISSASSRS